MAEIKIPLIEFSKKNMDRGSEGWASTMQAIRSAFEEYGCFEATYNEIEPNANDDLLVTLEELFNLDLETKQRLTLDAHFQGYDRREDPLFEFMAFSDALAFHNVESFISVLFPQGNRNVQKCEALHLFATKIWELEKVVRRMVFESFGVEDYFEEQENSMEYSVRINKYGSGTTKESRGNELRPHYDKNLLTILHEYGANGLQVKASNGNKWIRPTLSGSSFLVMAGELFFGWSNARVQCALHRVKMSEGEDSKAVRYSIGLFSTQKGTVKIPNEMVDEKHPLVFKPFDWIDLLETFIKEKDTQHSNGEYIIPTLKKHYAL